MKNEKSNLVWSVLNATLFGYVLFLILSEGFDKLTSVLFAIFSLSTTIQFYLKYANSIAKNSKD